MTRSKKILEKHWIDILNRLFSRIACGIDVPDSDNIVITGGWISSQVGLTRVVSYSVQGESTLLPSLQTPRYAHGCGYYFSNDQVVSCGLHCIYRDWILLNQTRHTWLRAGNTVVPCLALKFWPRMRPSGRTPGHCHLREIIMRQGQHLATNW